MGGFGSGRDAYSLRSLVEDCRVLNANRLAQSGVFRPMAAGILTWDNPQTGECRASVSYFMRPVTKGTSMEGYPWELWLSYVVGSERVDYSIPISTSVPHFGGTRFWLGCPVLKPDRTPCRRRVSKLYLASRYFACRSCNDLVYWSSRNAHLRERLDAMDATICRRMQELIEDCRDLGGKAAVR